MIRRKKNKIIWKKVVERKASPLFLDFVTRGINDHDTKKILGYELGYPNYLYLDKEVFSQSEDFNILDRELRRIIEKNSFNILIDFASKWERIIDELMKISAEINRKVKEKGNSQILSLFKKYVKKNYELSTSLMLPVNIEKILEEKIKVILLRKFDSFKIDHNLLIITSPDKINENGEELKSISKIALEIQNKNLDINSLPNSIFKLVDLHIKKYGWTNTPRFLGEPWTREDIINRLKNNLEENPKERLKELKKLEKNNKEEFNKIVKSLNLKNEEKKLIKIAKEYVFLRTYRINAFTKACYLARPFLKELANRMNLKFDDIVYLTYQEIVDFFENEESIKKDLIKERKTKFGMLIENDKRLFFSGKDVEIMRKKHIKEESFEGITEFKGVIANKGVAKGIAKIIKAASEIGKVNKGDILVSPMTIPDFVPAMEKAIAFITDEGGILCHAAIFSREMNKPCIISTKNATKILRDGDLIEVDANKGIVKIIKRGK